MKKPKSKKLLARGYACVGSHGKIYACAISQDPQKQGRFEIYTDENAARINAIYKPVKVKIYEA